MSNIVHLTTVHPVMDTRILVKECASLAAAGYDVTLVAPNNPNAVVPDNIRYVRLPPEKSRLRRMLLGPWRAFRAVLAQHPAICHFHDPELIPACVVLAFCGVKVIYDVHEDLPRQMRYKEYLPAWLGAVLGRLAAVVERLAVVAFSGVAAATPTIAARFPARKTVTVRNYPLRSEFTAPTDYSQRPPHAAYVGGISILRGIREMLAAMQCLTDHPEARLLLGGTFSPSSLENAAGAMPGNDRAEFLGCLTRREVARLLGSVRLGVVVLHPTENYMPSYPVKLFEYMAAGLPVVASDFPRWREIVAGSGCGLLVDPNAPAAIAAAIGHLLDHPDEAAAMGQRGLQAVAAQYNWEAEAAVLLDLYRRVET